MNTHDSTREPARLRAGAKDLQSVWRRRAPAPAAGHVAQREDRSGLDSFHTSRTNRKGLLDYLHILAQHKLVLTLAGVLGAVLGAAFFYISPKVYRVQTSIEYQDLNENPIAAQGSAQANASYSSESYIATQMRILQSEFLLRRAFKAVEPATPTAGSPPPGLREQILARLRVLGGAASETPIDFGSLAGGIKVRSPEGTRIVEISCDSPDARKAALFVNALTDSYIEQNLESRWDVAQRTGTWLNQQMDSTRVKLASSEQQLLSYARNTGLMLAGEKDNIAEDKLRQLQAELSKAQADRTQAQSRFELTGTSASTALSEVLDHGPLRDYQVRLTDLRRQYAELSTSLTPAHRSVQRIQAQISELESIMETERGNVVGRIRNEYSAAVNREKLLAGAISVQQQVLGRQSEKMAQYNLMKREVDSNRSLYELMLQKVKEYGIASALKASHIRVLDPALIPSSPHHPKILWSVALGLMGGLILGAFGVIGRDQANPTFKQPGELSEALNVPELGAIPITKIAAPRGRRNLRAPEGQLSLTPAEQMPSQVHFWNEQNSSLADSFRATLLSILYTPGEGCQVIAVSSPGPGEGKTTTVSNLGIALAESGRRVLLVEGDLRKPRLHRVFELSNTRGVTNILRDSAPIEQSVAGSLAVVTRIPGLMVIPAGSAGGRINDLLHSPRMAQFIDLCRREFDVVLIDTPPMSFLPDARILARVADSVVMVVRAHQTLRSEASTARQLLIQDGTPLLGAVLNHWDPSYGNKRQYQSYLKYANYSD